MDHLPQPPRLERRLEEPGRLLLVVLALGAIPGLAVAGGLEREARSSVIHVALSFMVLLLAFRVMGKRELSRLSPFELVTLMLIPETLSSSLQGEGSWLTALAGLCTVLVLVLTTSVLSQRFSSLKDVVESPPTVLVQNGKLLTSAMNRERITPDELYSEMRKQSVARLEELRFAVLESSGNITFIPLEKPSTSAPRDENQPI
ncbi:MAG: hypothetical protein K0R38_5918 [Polyangiaceae bacterium]|jgi:uncharacterized membrane protein YcaP (DUF421 family)|nr:hypothetical protein [Polyangiaceae bacterium]